MQEVSRGRELARAIIARAQPRATAVKRKLGRPATVAIIAGADEASRRFVQIKRDMLIEVDVEIESIWLEDGATTEDIVGAIHSLNSNHSIDAIFLQFPLPAGIDPQVASDAVAIHKDIDCSGQVAESRFVEGASDFIPVAPHAALDLLESELGDLRGRRVIVPADDAFGKALKALLARAGARTDAHQGHTDGLVFGETLPDAALLETIESVKVLLDAGYYLPPRGSGWVSASLRQRVRTFFTQFGNVGPLTVAHLAESTIAAADFVPD